MTSRTINEVAAHLCTLQTWDEMPAKRGCCKKVNCSFLNPLGVKKLLDINRAGQWIVFLYLISNSPTVWVWYPISNSPIVFLTWRPDIQYSDSFKKMCSYSPYSDIPIVFEKILAGKTILGSSIIQTEKQQMFPARFKPMSWQINHRRFTNCAMGFMWISENKYF